MVVNVRDLRPRLEAERLKGEFLAAVSHELRTPLAAILGLAELLRQEPLPPEAQESVELILESAFRLKNMVDNLLDTSRLGRAGLRSPAAPSTSSPCFWTWRGASRGWPGFPGWTSGWRWRSFP